MYPEKGDRIEEILDDMAKRGTVFRETKPGVGKRYRLLPSLAGWVETPFWHGHFIINSMILNMEKF